MNKKCDVILTYSWNRVGYNILRSLSDKKLKVVVADTSTTNICTVSNRCFDSFVYPDPFTNELAFVETLLEKIKYYNPDILIPTHDEGLIIAKYKHLFPANLIIPIDDYEKLVAISDKSIATNLAIKAGVPVPRCYSYCDQINKYPIVFKTKIGNSAKGVFFIDSNEKLQNIKSKYKEEEVLIQDKINGIDHSVDCIRMNGFFYATVYRALITKTHGGGTTTQRIIVDIPQLVEHARRLLDLVDYNGVCGIDFKYDEESQKCAFIEVNARYTGGLATPIKAGFDIPSIHYELAIKRSYNGVINLKVGTKTKWILGDFITLIERIFTRSCTFSDMRSIFNFSFDGYDDFFNDDKRAIYGELSYYFNKFRKNRSLNP